LILILKPQRQEELAWPPFLESEQIFYGLNSDYLQAIQTQILFLVTKGFSYSDVLSMPTWQRNNFISMLQPKEE
jgi:hypothetical protein